MVALLVSVPTGVTSPKLLSTSTSVLQHFLSPEGSQFTASALPQSVPAAGLCCGRTCPAHVLAAGCLCRGTGIRRDAWGSCPSKRVGVVVVVLKTKVERMVLGVEWGSGAERARETR